MDSRFVLGLWLYLQELHSKKQDVTETCNQEEMKIKKGFVILYTFFVKIDIFQLIKNLIKKHYFIRVIVSFNCLIHKLENSKLHTSKILTEILLS